MSVDAWEGEVSALYTQYIHLQTSFFSWSSHQLVESLTLRPGIRVLDLAGGAGLVSRMILAREPSAHITLLDISEAQLEHAKAIFGNRVEYVCSSAERYEPTEPFDIVVCANAFWYLHISVVPRIAQWLVPGGVLAFNLHERNSFFKEVSFFTKVHHEIDRLAREQYRTACIIYQASMDVSSLKSMLEQAGFLVEHREEQYEEPHEVWHVLCELQARRTAPYMGISIERDAKLMLYRNAFRAVLKTTGAVERHGLFFSCTKE